MSHDQAGTCDVTFFPSGRLFLYVAAVPDDSSSCTASPGLPASSRGGPPVFATTHWSVVVSAQNTASAKSAEALEALCRAYWKPLYAYIRRTGKAPGDAEDLTQSFFAKVIEKGYLLAADPNKGRFRTFLLTALKRFMANEWDKEHRQKRGGFKQVVPIDMELAESGIVPAPDRDFRPDILFDRQWAQTLLERTVATLRQEYLVTGRSALFEHIQPCLVSGESALSYIEIGRTLNLSEAAIKMAVFRLRSRFRDLLRAEVSETVASPDEVDDEIRILFSSF